MDFSRLADEVQLGSPIGPRELYGQLVKSDDARLVATTGGAV